MRRQPCFLAEADWAHMPFLGRCKTPRDHLNDIAVQIPALLHRVDNVMCQLEKTPSIAQPEKVGHALPAAQTLLKELAEMDERIQAWYADVEAEQETSRSMVALTISRSPNVTPLPNGSTLPFRFPSIPAAGMYTHAWSHRLELKMCSIVLRRVALGKALLLPGESSVDIVRLLVANEKSAEELAASALEASSWPAGTLEGLMALQFPLKTLDRYFNQQDLRLAA